VIEAESSKVGERMIPPAVWQAMAAAPQIVLTAPLAARARALAAIYGESAADPDAAMALLQRLPRRPGRRQLAAWRELLRAGALEQLAAALIEQHYDPAYRRASRKLARPSLGEIAIEDVRPETLDRATETIVRMVER
jgi:tRNA 2-selenouridine synthase